ncbi:hypothetical protein QW060_16900 [Myroides ceti]|uniref:Uncharacterized protein n=1 Tax=Paenimyroides ceti TaxID=395087 RepID=A0ABT8CW71_9FLAO|nr:hypothetical protein [Paenimyroides ceti]MDN3708783.1 hypothetical protein [Paenimyroides ceti]
MAVSLFTRCSALKKLLFNQYGKGIHRWVDLLYIVFLNIYQYKFKIKLNILDN